ncbi:ankyrin repeat domain-containing protein 40-like [Uloborus diversus]|uniref:ankyrin repeat domain-containing protein 40-like n=1 Tax=Uloborus diversus TaxID=327109 RepID=UPI002409BE0A|nr:ankyrin repeat domain-containing protein 40-like [Uloborus diversus]
MNPERMKEELLLEASAYGDENNVKELLKSGVNINAQNSVNGWTALHWAAKRGHSNVVNYLLLNGADASLTSNHGETPFSLARKEDIKAVLPNNCCEESQVGRKESPLPITPNYLSNPPLTQSIDMQNIMNSECPKPVLSRNYFDKHVDDELVLKVRTSDPPNQDFIEVEVPREDLSYENVFKICCEELEILPKNVFKLRKLPNTIVRKDKDVLRFQNFQELELVINMPSNTKQTSQFSQDYQKASSNGCDDTSKFVSKSCLVNNSNFCKNGEILY